MTSKKKIESLYCEYITANEAEIKALFRTIKIIDESIYYQLQRKIFFEMQKPLYKELANMFVDDCMKYFAKFSISLAGTLIDEMQFLDISSDIKSANMARLQCLNFINDKI